MTMKNLIIPNKQNHNKQLIYIVAIFLLANIAFAQETDSTLIPTSYINIVGRYTDGKGVELRFFPNKKSVLEVGLKNGLIECFSIQQIKETKPKHRSITR